PFLFATFPVLFLYAENVNMVSVDQVWAPLGLLLLFAGIVVLISRLIFRSWYKAGLFTSGFVLLFFLYNPVFSAIQHKKILDIISISRHREFLPILLTLFGLFIIYLLKTKSKFTKLTQVLNVMALILIIPSLSTLGFHS